MKGPAWGLPYKALILLVLAAGVLSKARVALMRPLNSDDSQPAVVFYDIVTNHNYFLKNWFVVTNSHLLTEFPLYFLMGSAFDMSPLTLKAGAFVIFLVSALLLMALLYRVWGALPALGGGAVVFSSSLYASGILLSVYNHVSAVALSLACILLILRLMERQKETGFMKPDAALCTAVVFICLIAVFSNPFFIFTFIVPAAVSYAALRIFRIRLLSAGTEVALFPLMFTAAALGLQLQKEAVEIGLYISKLPSEQASPAQMLSNVSSYVKSMGWIFGITLSKGIAEAARTISGLVLLAFSGWTALAVLKREAAPGRRFLILYFIALSALIFAAYIPKAVVAPRYLIPMVYAFSFFLALAMGGDYFRSKRLRYVLIFIFVIYASANVHGGLTYRDKQPRAGLAGFLKEKGLTYGYSNYWNANVLTMLSGNEVKVRPVEFAGYALKPFYWVSNADWYKPSRHHGPTFLLVAEGVSEHGFDMLSPSLISQMFGLPAEVLRHDGAIIYVWPYNIMKALLSSVELSERTLHTAGEFRLTDTGKVLHAARGDKGFLVQSSPWTLQEGSYRVTFIMSVSGAAGVKAARIEALGADLSASSYKPETFSEEVIAYGEDGSWREYAVDFTVGSNARGNVAYDFRVFVTGEAEVILRSIAIEPL